MKEDYILILWLVSIISLIISGYLSAMAIITKSSIMFYLFLVSYIVGLVSSAILCGLATEGNKHE